MKCCGLFFASLFMVCIAAGCSYVTHATLFNNTGDKIEVEWQSKKALIAASDHAEIDYVISSTLEARVSGGNCEYLYRVSVELRNYRPDRKLDRGIQIQVEKDFSIDLLPTDYAGDAPATSALLLQREGFPLHPVSRKCL
ncbi:MAG TPA: hypothetical protein VJQ06_05170 [Rhizomicrobium sp.]|nr:hypothetical protein [Rhizomicrobium sp.]